MFESRAVQIYNSTPVIIPEGEVIIHYSKVFPFNPSENGVTPGTEFCVFDVENVGRSGASSCYDT